MPSTYSGLHLQRTAMAQGFLLQTPAVLLVQCQLMLQSSKTYKKDDVFACTEFGVSTSCSTLQ